MTGSPASQIPFFSAQVISGIKELNQRQRIKLRNGKKCGGFHLNRHAAFISAQRYFFGSFPIDCIGGSGFAL